MRPPASRQLLQHPSDERGSVGDSVVPEEAPGRPCCHVLLNKSAVAPAVALTAAPTAAPFLTPPPPVSWDPSPPQEGLVVEVGTAGGVASGWNILPLRAARPCARLVENSPSPAPNLPGEVVGAAMA